MSTDNNQQHTYRRIRNAIGVLGISLPVLLLGLPLFPFFKTVHQESISHYYYTNLRELFTGVLCAVGLFLIRYKGHVNPNFFKNDNKLTNIAGAMAFGIAVFPTDPDFANQKIYSLVPYHYEVLGYVHYGFAAIFFVFLAILSINVFTIGQEKNKNIVISIINENKIYRTCGVLMLVCVVLVFVLGLYDVPYATIICETMALFFFGFSWLIKGRAFGTKRWWGRMVYREEN
jgi:hypothetical protein